MVNMAGFMLMRKICIALVLNCFYCTALPLKLSCKAVLCYAVLYSTVMVLLLNITKIYCIVLYWTAVFCTLLYYTVLYCTVMHFTVKTLLYCTVA